MISMADRGAPAMLTTNTYAARTPAAFEGSTDDRDESELMTGEAVALDVRPASFILRAAGSLIDWLAYALLLVGLGLAICALSSWGAAHFGPLSVTQTMRLVIPSSAALLLGFQVIYGAFFISILQVRASSRLTAALDPGP